MITNIILIIILTLLTFPITHIFIKKGIVLDYFLKDKTKKKITRFFYIPYLNIVISFFYLIWVIIKFKRPE